MDALSRYTYQGELKQAVRCKKRERIGVLANLDLKREREEKATTTVVVYVYKMSESTQITGSQSLFVDLAKFLSILCHIGRHSLVVTPNTINSKLLEVKASM